MAPEITLDQMKERLADARKRLESTKREVTAWEQVVALEESKGGIRASAVPVPNKSEILRDFLRAHQNKGVTYRQIREHYVEVGVPMGSNFIYNLINKWAEQIKRKDGKIFWVGD